MSELSDRKHKLKSKMFQLTLQYIGKLQFY